MRKGRGRRLCRLLVVLALLVAGCGTPATTKPSEGAPFAPTPSPDPAAVCKDCWPLSGKPAKLGAVDRRPLLVKIDNVPAARPHYGLSEADMVFEIIVEGSFTRLAAIFHSQDTKTIGNIRSARLADRSLTPMVRGALVYSGTSAYEVPLIQSDAAQGKYVDLSADYTQGYYRVTFRPGPYNMFTSASAMREAIAAKGANTSQTVPSWGFFANPEHDPKLGGMAGSVAATQLTIPYREDQCRVEYTYDPQTRTYARSQNANGKPVRDIDANNKQPIAAANVLVVKTEIWEVAEIVDSSGAHAHDMRLVGGGEASVFRDGLRQDGVWARASETEPFVFKSQTGERIVLNPGQTWIHVVPNDWTITSQ